MSFKSIIHYQNWFLKTATTLNNYCFVLNFGDIYIEFSSTSLKINKNKDLIYTVLIADFSCHTNLRFHDIENSTIWFPKKTSINISINPSDLIKTK